MWIQRIHQEMEFISMSKPKLNRTEDLPATPSADNYAPREYSAREHAAIGAKIILVVGLLFGFLWLVDAMASK